MKARLFFAASLIAVAAAQSCSTKESESPESANPGFEEFYASVESPESKVYSDDQLHLLWNAGDRISVFNRSAANQEFIFQGKDGDKSGTFSGGTGPGSDFDKVYAVYPYHSQTGLSGGKIVLALPNEQKYVPGTFDPAANIMVAASTDQYLRFKNVCGILSFRLCGTGIKLKSLILQGNNNEALAGNVEVSVEPGGEPATAFSYGIDKLTLNCDGVELDASTTTEFWFNVPPLTFSKGFTVTVDAYEGQTELRTDNSVTVNRSRISRMLPYRLGNAPAKLTVETIPDIEYDGAGALEYYYASAYPISGYNPGALINNHENAEAHIYNKTEPRYSASPSFVPSVSTARYLVSPAGDYDFDLDMFGRNNSAGGSGEVWAPSVVDYDYNQAGAELKVKYSIDKPQGLSDATLQLFARDSKSGVRDFSDEMRVVPRQQEFKAFCFNNNYKGVARGGGLHDELYPSAIDAAGNLPSFEALAYIGQTPIDFIGVHVTEADGTVSEYSQSQLQDKYPNLNVIYETLPYTLGESATAQDAFCHLQASGGSWYYQPAYAANIQGDIRCIPISPWADIEGMSAIGRQPMIMATLIDAGANKALLAGYFKFEIINPYGDQPYFPSDPVDPYAEPLIMRDFSASPVSAGSSASFASLWIDTSYTLLEYWLGISHKSFRKYYSDYIDANTYVKMGGQYIASDQYGSVVYHRDPSDSVGISDWFEIVVNEAQSATIADLYGSTITLYAKMYHPGDYRIYYLGFVLKAQE